MPDTAHHSIIKSDITVGNMVSWILVVGGFVYGYSQLNSKVDNLTQSLTTMQVTDNNLQAQINVMRDISTARQIEISTKMTRIETIIERTEGKLENRLPLTIVPKQ